MKKIFFTIISLCPLITFAQNGHFILKAEVSGLTKPVMAYLAYNNNGKSVLDSLRSSTGSFEFSGNVSGVLSARLTLDHTGAGLYKRGIKRDMLPLYLENGNIIVTATDSIKNGIITGSVINQQNIIYQKFLSVNNQTFESLVARSESATQDQRKDDNFREQMSLSFKKMSEERENLQQQFIKQHPDFYISYLALVEIAGPIIDVDKISPLFDGLSAEVRISAAGLAFEKQIAMARTTSIGAVAPAFTQNDVDNKPVSLSSFRGKYVLVDFWASWCGPCRAENPNVVKAYHRYKGKNFTILGVSLDRPGKKDAWLAAIKADGLEWTQVADFKFWENEAAKLYGIRAIPQNFLIGPDGKIIGKNLTGEDLEKKLEEILGY